MAVHYYEWYYTVLFFMAYSVGGWLCECVYCSVLDKKLVNRGFLNGPVCPIYGTGAILVIMFLLPVKNSIIAVFLLGTAITCALEYFTSWLMEQLFDARWWDYSNYRFHIHGRVCLLNGVLFGVMCVLLMQWIHPFVSGFVLALPRDAAAVLACASAVVMLADAAVTVHAAVTLKIKLEELRALAEELKYSTQAKRWYYENRIQAALETVNTQNNSDRVDLHRNAKDRWKKLSENHFLHRRLIEAFPNMKHKKYRVQLAALRLEWKTKHGRN
ncbi:MAG: putative ABC transporter permease [Oscillospiraceae bacterium]|nr:putative ABC transporter permease [Oscillospiraceae bacterium]